MLPELENFDDSLTFENVILRLENSDDNDNDVESNIIENDNGEGDNNGVDGTDVVNGEEAYTNNFPYLPKICCIKPCFYQDFEKDILPGVFRKIAKRLYYIWILHSVVNLYSGFVNFFVFDVMTAGLRTFSSMIHVPLIYVFWFRPAYSALCLKNYYSLNFVIFFLVSLIFAILLGLQCVGIVGFGSLGIRTVNNNWKHTGSALGTINMVITWGLICLLSIDLYYIVQMRIMFMKASATLRKALTEFKRLFGIESNEDQFQFELLTNDFEI